MSTDNISATSLGTPHKIHVTAPQQSLALSRITSRERKGQSKARLAHRVKPRRSGDQDAVNATRGNVALVGDEEEDEDSWQFKVVDSAYPSPQIEINAPIGPLGTGKNGENIQDVGQWFFLSQLPDRDKEYFKPAQNHWATALWAMAHENQPMVQAMAAFASHKKATLGAKPSKAIYLEQKGRMIRSIESDLSKTSTTADPLTIVAIAILAYLDIRDTQFDNAETHLQAVKRFVDLSTLPVHAWLYVVWIDLRYALFTDREPMLPYYVPLSLRQVPGKLNVREAFKLGLANAEQCPRSPVMTLSMARDLFPKLHVLCQCSTVLSDSDVLMPPFGHIYDLEYILRIIQSRARKRDQQHIFNIAIELVTTTAQFHVWIGSRFWTPQRKESHLALLKRACDVFDGQKDIVTHWSIHVGLESLLWVLFTFTSALRTYELPQAKNLVVVLYTTLRKMNIARCEDLEVRLRKWPWLENCHPCMVDYVWGMLVDRYPDMVPYSGPRVGTREAVFQPGKAQQRWFLGGLEFFNSL